RAAGVDMAEVGGQQRHAGVHVGAVAIPAEQGPNREAVAQIMWPRSTLRRARLEARAADQVEPGEVHVAVEESGAGGGEEERGHDRAGMQLVAAAGVGGERGDGARVQRDLVALRASRLEKLVDPSRCQLASTQLP